ncbi:MAG TPA: lipocalin family protein [Spirochaetota bacterium]|nr:lipocalin family protein [Spirochaetota bacterium]HNT11313.1 lipocalin family protein [Spirochaetota bacterium]HOS41008.1 lipocalin family protein [Spirochaetota bacterium]
MKKKLYSILCAAGLVSSAACQSAPGMETVPYVDLPRFMGDWYVIACIPTFIETKAHNAVESYALSPDGTIATTFTFRDGSFDGPAKRYTPRGFVVNRKTNAEWGMQFIWPIKGEFLIVYLRDDYGVTIIGRSKRDYVWLMARTPAIPEEEYRALVKFIGDRGYDVGRLYRVPQKWDAR